METAKVDIRKLQTLSDCISRTIEALNQVRLSVHAGNLPYATLGLQQTLGAFPNAFGNTFGNAFGIAPQITGQVPGVIPGFAHSAPAFFNQFAGVSPLTNLAAQAALNQAALNQAAFNPAFNNAWTNANLNGNAFTQFGQTGLGHTGVNTFGVNSFTNNDTFVDPYTNARIAQTFPFVHWGYSPFGWPTV